MKSTFYTYANRSLCKLISRNIFFPHCTLNSRKLPFFREKPFHFPVKFKQEILIIYKSTEIMYFPVFSIIYLVLNFHFKLHQRKIVFKLRSTLKQNVVFCVIKEFIKSFCGFLALIDNNFFN